MALDEPKDTDNVYEINGFQFVMDKDFDRKVQPVKVDFMGYGFSISSNLASNESCSACGTTGTCGG